MGLWPRAWRKRGAHGLSPMVDDGVERAREVWTVEDAKRLKRAFAFLRERGVGMPLYCKRCGAGPGAQIRLVVVGGGVRYRCGCTDRVVEGRE